MDASLPNEPTTIRPSPTTIFLTWLTIGFQSFGGGNSTFALINRACVNRGWLSEDEFMRTWAISQISPGINLIKFTILIGHRLAGWPGLIAGVAGLLVPSAGITILLTAGYTVIQDNPTIAAIMRGILPATIGLGLAMAAQMALPLFKQARSEGLPGISASLVILAAAAVVMYFGLAPLLVLLFSGLAAAFVFAFFPTRGPEQR